MDNEKENLKEEVQVVDNFNWIVPECCREGWKSCPHTVRRQKTSKRNIGL